MLYQLSYASKFGGKTRLRANLSLRSLPDVRDNYLRYHKGKLRCNRRSERVTSSSYSSRNATMGSTRAARRAGIMHAASATAVRTTVTRLKVAGSRTGTPNTRLDTA